MTLRFRYQRFFVKSPLIALGGQTWYPRPIIPVSLIGPTGIAVAKDALLDTGATNTVFPEAVAVALGLDLSTAPTSTGSTVGAPTIPLRFAAITLRVADNQQQREWQAWVGFTASKMRHPLLGYAGFLQFFSANFHGDREEAELTVNSRYTGT